MIPQHAGLVACQFGRDGAKGKFADVFLELARGSVELRDGGRHGEVLRTAGVIGCTVSVPKKPRKGQAHAFRVDLAADTVDSMGECKYIIGVDTAEEMQHWMNVFKAAASTAQDGGEQEASEVDHNQRHDTARQIARHRQLYGQTALHSRRASLAS